MDLVNVNVKIPYFIIITTFTEALLQRKLRLVQILSFRKNMLINSANSNTAGKLGSTRQDDVKGR